MLVLLIISLILLVVGIIVFFTSDCNNENYKSKNKNLVITSAGDNNNINEWVKGNNKNNWDLIVIYYGDDAKKMNFLRGKTDLFLKHKDGKFPNVKWFNEKHPHILKKYKNIFVTDDDLIMSGKDINTLFDTHDKYNLYLSSPSHSSVGKISFNILKHKENTELSFTNFIEMNFPCFKTEFLLHFLKELQYDMKGWGTDVWFLNVLERDFQSTDELNTAVIHKIVAINPLDNTKIDKKREIDKLQKTEDRIKIFQKYVKKYNLKKINSKVIEDL